MGIASVFMHPERGDFPPRAAGPPRAPMRSCPDDLVMEVNRMVAKPALGEIRPQAISNGAAPPVETLWVHFEATIPEPLANVFSTLTPWRWRELRPFFCRYPENRRLRNIGQSIHALLERGPH